MNVWRFGRGRRRPPPPASSGGNCYKMPDGRVVCFPPGFVPGGSWLSLARAPVGFGFNSPFAMGAFGGGRRAAAPEPEEEPPPPPPPPPSPPAAPTGLAATAGDQLVDLAWNASAGATSYNVKRSTTSGGPYTTVATGVTGTSHSDTGLTNGTTYFYVVSAVNDAGESADSNEASATPQPPPGPGDALTDPGFTVPFSTTTPVSGGGAALQAAVTAAAAGTRLQIMDSLTYSPVDVVGKTNLTIEAAAGQTPVIKRPVIVPATENQLLRLIGAVDGFAIRGVTFSGNGNRNSAAFTTDGLLCAQNTVPVNDCTFADRIIVEDCTFTEDGTDNANSGPGIEFTNTAGPNANFKRVFIHRCVFLNNANGANVTAVGYGVCTVAGFENVWIENCSIERTDAIVARAASHMRGYVWKNGSTIVEDCLAFDLGTAGSNESFNHLGSASFGSVVGPSTVRNCVAYRAKRGYRMQQAGATMTVTTSVYHTNVAGILVGQVAVRQSAGTMVFRNNVMVGAGDGTAFEAAVTEDHNDVFNFGALGKVLDATDLTIDPVFEDVPTNLWVATAAALQTTASDGGAMGVRYPGGEEIIWIG